MVIDVKSTTQATVTKLNLDAYSRNSSTRLSIFTLTTILGCIYGVAFMLAIVWVIWLWRRKKPLVSGLDEYRVSPQCCC